VNFKLDDSQEKKLNQDMNVVNCNIDIGCFTFDTNHKNIIYKFELIIFDELA